jgi:hypothetical protein
LVLRANASSFALNEASILVVITVVSVALMSCHIMLLFDLNVYNCVFSVNYLLQRSDLAVLEAAQFRRPSRDNFALSALPLMDLFLQDESRSKLSEWLSVRLGRNGPARNCSIPSSPSVSLHTSGFAPEYHAIVAI